MKKLLVFTGFSLALVSCNINYASYLGKSFYSYPTANTSNRANTEREYNELMKTYKPETTDVLNDLLNNNDPSNPRTSISVENNSPCNMVLTVSGKFFFKKIPIGAGKIGYIMVPKNQTYKLSGMLCNSIYQSTKFITTYYSVKLSN